MAEKFRDLKAVTIPVLTTAERDALNPFLGLIIYNLNTDLIEVWNGDSWTTNIVRFQHIEGHTIRIAPQTTVTPTINDTTSLLQIVIDGIDISETTMGNVFDIKGQLKNTFSGKVDWDAILIENKLEATSATSGTLRGLKITAPWPVSGTYDVLTALYVTPVSAAGIGPTTSHAIHIPPIGTWLATTTTHHGILIEDAGNTLTPPTTAFALKIDDITGGTNRYPISQEGSNGQNWFRAKTAVGATSRPTSLTDQLEVTGDLGVTDSIMVTEKADANADVAGRGQIWVNTSTPNELYFTDDAGNDVQLTPRKFHPFRIVVEDPTSSEDIYIGFTNEAITVTEMRAVLLGSSTPSVTWTIRHGTDRNAAGAEIVTSGTTTTNTTTGDDVTSFNDATIVADSHIWLETTAKSGTVDEIGITIIGNVD
jgi:hypothetical protein